MQCTAAARWLILCQESVCHEAAVGLSAESSTASAFSTLPVLYEYYHTGKQIREESLDVIKIFYDRNAERMPPLGGILFKLFKAYTYWSNRSNKAVQG